MNARLEREWFVDCAAESAALEPEDVNLLPDALLTVIVRRLEQAVQFPVLQGEIRPPFGYVRFVEVLKRLAEKGHRVSILTFNYDAAIERALELAGFEIDYGHAKVP